MELTKNLIEGWRATLLANANNDTTCITQLNELCDFAQRGRVLVTTPRYVNINAEITRALQRDL